MVDSDTSNNCYWLILTFIFFDFDKFMEEFQRGLDEGMKNANQ